MNSEFDKNNNEFNLKKMFEEARLLELSQAFEIQYPKLEKKRRLIRQAKFGLMVLAGLGLGVFLLVYNGKSLNNKASGKDTIMLKVQSPNTKISSLPAEENIIQKNPGVYSSKKIIIDTKKEQTVDTTGLSTSTVIKEEPLISKTPISKAVASIPKKEETGRYELIEDKCKNVKIKSVFKMQHPCSNKNDGVIQIITSTGGEQPYKFQLGTDLVKNTGIFDRLTASYYTITTVDANGCKSQPEELQLIDEICPEESDLIYSLSRDNEVRIPVQKGDLLKIINKRGEVLVQKTIENDFFIFNQESLQGQPLKEGLYILFITRVTGKILRNEVTVLP